MKKATLIIIVLFFYLNSNAQKYKGQEKIKVFKIAFLTEKLNLTENEAEKFWPIYNAYERKKTELRREKRFNIKNTIRKTGGIDSLNEETSKKLIEKLENLDKKRLKNRTEFSKKIKKIFSYKKILKLEISEYEFNHKLMRKLYKNNCKK